MAQLHLYSSDHIILVDSPGRAPRVGYVLKFKNIASDPGFAAPINTRIGRRAPGIVLRAQVSGARPRRPPSRPSTLLSKQCHEPRGPGPRLRSPGFFVKKPAPGLLGEQLTLQLFTSRASLKPGPEPAARSPKLLFSPRSSWRWKERPAAPQSDLSCPFLSALAERGGPEGQSARLACSSQLRSDPGTASDFLKNYFNQV